jgi:hypothetical protein
MRTGSVQKQTHGVRRANPHGGCNHPVAFALLVDWVGWRTSLCALFGCSLVTWMAMELMSRWYEGAQARARSHLATET